MHHRETTSHERPLLADHAALLNRTPLTPPLTTKHTRYFAITTVTQSEDMFDLLISLKGRATTSATIVFENLSRAHARGLLNIVTEKGSTSALDQDPVRSITLLLEALSYAELQQVAAHTPTGHPTHDVLSRFFDAEIETFSEEELLKMVRIEGLGGGIYHLSFPNQYMMNAAFLRPQEYFESPKYRGKVFTRDEFQSWYCATRPHGQFSYYTDWGGFNLPDKALKPFFRGAFNPLSPLEKIIIEPFRDMKGPLYLIGTLQGDARETLRHEIAHALYHTNPHYREEVEQALSIVNLTPINRCLKGMGYHRLRWKDEAHAYIGDLPAELETFGINSLLYKDARQKLLRIYNAYSPIRHLY